ncbi:MAG TPA: alpha/beta hydrolase [Cryomorphaceae bacterium]|nr:alpha/beta hydrolase [Owenweeksia sp.]MBF99993.1 alpha/beta hydrolase [Owenweeksia sp.]HAD97216.1 alpha/beta hydrolase [Cryomorphaceae bacterium]HBF18939.1 alpha/beta hydrolase [Cryomorphaceae bacterium]HCQ15359.1 alpha/beta hydrolase [Cryomorphaceae bacterium]|tara:strand:- start:977 stop:1939 length:963 start_codon:yes stop_codon:yes gene_type:complete
MSKPALLAALLLSFSVFAQKVRIEVEQPIPIGEKDTVYGTLLSEGKSLKEYHDIPLIIIVAGSGPTDRNGNSAVLPGPNDAYKQMADSLLEKHIATFRYDKPAIGKSTFSGTEEKMRFETNSEVLGAVIASMKDLGFDDIFLLGHSEGSLVAMLAAQQNKVSGFISMAGPGRDSHTLIKEQLAGKLPEKLEKQTFEKLDSIKAGYTVEKYNASVASLIRKSIQPYLRSYFQYNPAKEISKLDIPVLIIQGGRDMQVKEMEGEILKKAKPEARYIFYPEMNHVLKRVDESQEQNSAAYYDPDFPLEENLVKDMASWVHSHK